jgi:hypothetical protein
MGSMLGANETFVRGRRKQISLLEDSQASPIPSSHMKVKGLKWLELLASDKGIGISVSRINVEL